jgi:hypothetical protein
MSSHSEEKETRDIPTEDETYDEIESELEEIVDIEGDEYEMSDHDSDIPEIFDEPLQLDELLTSVLATPDGDTVCSALVNISHQLEVQNKILIKVLSAIGKK